MFIYINISVHSFLPSALFQRQSNKVSLGVVFCFGKENIGITVSGEMEITISEEF